jgi:glycosyltransferase A (GT-A) superfamily protein (DUF2064 family)
MADLPSPRAVLLMARAPRPGTTRPALEPLIGAARCAELQTTLVARACAWAGEVAPGSVHVAYEPVDAGPELRELLGPKVSLFPQSGTGISGRLAQASARVFARADGPVLIIWPDLPRWRRDHGYGALDDLIAGCDVSLGPEFDGGFYMIGLARPLPALFSLPETSWRSPDAMSAAIGAAVDAGLEVGLLRAERGLRRPEDVRAVLADPLTDTRLRGILEPSA